MLVSRYSWETGTAHSWFRPKAPDMGIWVGSGQWTKMSGVVVGDALPQLLNKQLVFSEDLSLVPVRFEFNGSNTVLETMWKYTIKFVFQKQFKII